MRAKLITEAINTLSRDDIYYFYQSIEDDIYYNKNIIPAFKNFLSKWNISISKLHSLVSDMLEDHPVKYLDEFNDVIKKYKKDLIF